MNWLSSSTGASESLLSECLLILKGEKIRRTKKSYAKSAQPTQAGRARQNEIQISNRKHK